MAKRHHFVSAFHLAKWADNGTRTGRIWAFHHDKSMPIPTSPDNCAVEGHFNTIRAEGLAPDSVENFYMELEQHSAPIFTKVIEERSLPVGQDGADFLYFIAHQVTRVHFARELVEDIGTQMMKTLVDFLMENPVAFNQMIETAKQEGHDLISYEEFKGAWDEGLEFEMNPALRIAHAIELTGTVYEELAKRPWTLVFSDDEAPNFIISDNPVVRSRRAEKQGWYEAPYGPNFDMHMPLSPKVAIYSSKDRAKEACDSLTEEEIARLNTATLKKARRQCYSSEPDFSWWNELQNCVGDWKDFVAFRTAEVKLPADNDD